MIFTARQREILGLMYFGLSNREIAAKIGLSLSRVNQVTEEIREGTGTHDRTRAVTVALEYGVLSVQPRRVKRKKRKGEFICLCRAYPFPHRFGSGKCSLAKWVGRFWALEPHSPACQECHCYHQGECEVDSGIEGPMECIALQEFMHQEEITVPLKFRRK